MKKKNFIIGALMAAYVMFIPQISYGMHIFEGFLSPKWSVIWTVIALPFLIYGFKKVATVVKENPEQKILLGLVGGFVFILSALKFPSVTGSTSHPTGTGLGTIIFGPAVMFVLGSIVLVFQALLLAHGGITTLGANSFSMAMAGPMAAYVVWTLFKKNGWNKRLGVFLTAMVADLFTYVVTAFQLAIFAQSEGGNAVPFLEKLTTFLGIFAVTQVPLAIIEGIVTVIVMNFLYDFEEKGVISFEK